MRHLAFLLPLALLAGCATAGDARVLVAGTEATLSVGETVALPDASRLTYVGVTSDSRCRPDVQCIQAGNAVVAFRHVAGADSHDVAVDTRQGTADLGAWRLTLASLDFSAPPKATVRIDAAR